MEVSMLYPEKAFLMVKNPLLRGVGVCKKGIQSSDDDTPLNPLLIEGTWLGAIPSNKRGVGVCYTRYLSSLTEAGFNLIDVIIWSNIY